MKKLIKNKKGFTLIELIVVIAILAVLAAILIPSIMNYVGTARTARNNSNARALYSEVAAELAMGTGTAATTLTRTEGGVKCDWTLNSTTGALATFVCTVPNTADGTITATFSP